MSSDAKVKGFMGLVILVLAVLCFWFMNANDGLSRRIEERERVYTAMLDSTRILIRDGVKVSVRQVPEAELKDIIESAYFDRLAEDQKRFYKELAAQRNVLASVQAKLDKQGEMLGDIAVGDDVAVDSTHITFPRGYVAEHSDTSSALKYSVGITMDDPLRFSLKYRYTPLIRSTFERQRDKSVVVKYTVDDPDAQVTDITAFTIPYQDGRTKLEKWMDKNKLPIIGTACVVTFATGAYVGYNIAR